MDKIIINDHADKLIELADEFKIALQDEEYNILDEILYDIQNVINNIDEEIR